MESGLSMERDDAWIPPTPGKPVLTSVQGDGKENIDDEFPCRDYFDVMRCMKNSGINATYELAASILDEHERVLRQAGKDPKSTPVVQYDTSSMQEEAVVRPSECDINKAHGDDKTHDGIGSVPTPSKTKESRKRSNDGVDMNKKPYQRPRVKKHRPKVFDDSKPKKIPKAQTPRDSTPRPKTPKPVTPRRVQERRTQSKKNKFTGSTNNGDENVVQDVQVVSTASIVSVKSCKRSLSFDQHLVDTESHHVSNLQEVLPRVGFSLEESLYYSKIVTSKRNTPRRSKFQRMHHEVSNDRKCVFFYQRRKKTSSDTTSHFPTFLVYRRSYRKNQCLQNSKKCGPVFPKMFKKRRTLRRKGSIVWWYKDGNVRRSHRIRKQTTSKKVQNEVNKSKSKKGLVKPDLFTKEWDLRVFSLHPRRKRSIMLTRPYFNRMYYNNENYFLCQEENVLQNKECLPLQEVPVHKIESFTSLHRDFQQFDNSDGNLNWLQLHEVPVLGNKSLVPRHAEKPLTKKDLNNLYASEMMKYLIMEMEKLDINGQCKELVVRNNNVSGALVKIVPKKRKVIPKVDLDKETLRVWKLLMENDGSEPVEETGKDQEEWWERQRDIFRGRVDSFIAKMHLIQGDRRFSPWKGSVIDSVVGVYLTQNVADHLSSSAFMSVVARFPAKSRSKVDDNVEALASQESVTSNTLVHRGFPENNEIEQDMNSSCADLNDVISTMELENDSVSNPFLVQDKTCVNSDSDSFRKLLEVEEADYLKQFSLNKSLVNESKVDGDLRMSNIEGEKQSAISFNLSSSHEPSANVSDVNVSLSGTSESEFVGQWKSTHEEKPKVAAPICSVQSEVTFEQGLDAVNNHQSINLSSSHEPSANVSDVNVSLSGTSESEFVGQWKSSHEEKPKVAAPICSVQSEVTFEQGLDAVNNHQSMKEVRVEARSMGKKKNKIEKKQETKTDWEELRKTYCKMGGKETSENNMDAADWDAVRRATVKELADIIVERGMNNVLAERIKDFLDRMYKDHGTLDLEWLRDVPPDKAKEFLLSIEGIGLKSVECVRLLTLHHLAFPVDTNVGRVATRLGWVPLQPLPDAVQIHLLNAYPMVDTIQKYLFPRLCTLDQRTLYELHYQLITFGKVFCTKVKPNCNACPMRGECRHYASALASDRLALPGSKESSTVTSIVPAANEESHSTFGRPPSSVDLEVNHSGSSSYHGQTCEPIIEVPPSPEPEVEERLPAIGDIEDLYCESDDEIPTIRLNTEEFKETLKDTIDANNISLPEADMSKALVALSTEAASFRVPQMKFVARLRTMHLVYELPDSHPCLAGFDEREHDDPSPYLLRIWLPGEIPKSLASTQNVVCDSAENNHEETVKGTILIPCRTATRGTFPLNGTYFQVNEVFADDETSHVPMDIPRSMLWNLPTRELGCGSSATSIFRALSTGAIQRIFWRGSICVRGFNRKTRLPRPLHHRFHISTTAVAAENKKLGKR